MLTNGRDEERTQNQERRSLKGVGTFIVGNFEELTCKSVTSNVDLITQ